MSVLKHTVTDVAWTRASGLSRPLRVHDIRTEEGGRLWRVLDREYGSAAEYVAHAAPRSESEEVISQKTANMLLRGECANGYEWTFGSAQNLATATRWLQDGTASQKSIDAYTVARDALEPDVQSILASAPTSKRHRVLAEEGDEVHLDRYLRGEENCMWQRKRGRKRSKVTLTVNLGLSCGNGEETFANIIGGVAAGAEVLERCGFAVQIDGIDCATDNSDQWYDPRSGEKRTSVSGIILRWPIKSTEERVDVMRLLSVGQNATLRAFGFGNVCFDLPMKSYGNLGQAMMPEYLRAAIGADYICGAWWTGEDGKQIDVREGLRRIAETAA